MSASLAFNLFLLSLGIVVLVKGAILFIDYSLAAAKQLGVSEHVIGVTLVAIATSVPELAVSSIASWLGNPEIAMGNILGSNVANMTLVLGVTLLFFPVIRTKKSLADAVIMLGATLLLWLFLFTGESVTRPEGLLLLSLYGCFIFYVLRRKDDTPIVEESCVNGDHKPLFYVALSLLLGIVVVAGANMVVIGASGLADGLRIHPLVIGGTIVAVGTSLPELASSLVAGMKKKHSVALGNIVGSNIMNILCVAGASALISPMGTANMPGIHGNLLFISLVSMLVVAMALRNKIDRRMSVLLLILYVAFLGILAGVL